MTKLTILTEIDEVLSSNRVAELDRMLDVVFEGGNGCPHADDGDWHGIHTYEIIPPMTDLHRCRCTVDDEDGGSVEKIELPFASAYMHPVSTMLSWISLIREGNPKTYKQWEVYVKNVVNEAHWMELSKEEVIGKYGKHCAESISNHRYPLGWDVWLFMEENPDFNGE
jgi:hypothetical protein